MLDRRGFMTISALAAANGAWADSLRRVMRSSVRTILLHFDVFFVQCSLKMSNIYFVLQMFRPIVFHCP